MKEELTFELTGDDGLDYESQDWIRKIDRIDLRHVSFVMYSLLLAMKLRLQAVLQQSAYSHSMKECDEVKYHWNTLSVNWEAEEGKVLLPMIIQLWVTMRGFAC